MSVCVFMYVMCLGMSRFLCLFVGVLVNVIVFVWVVSVCMSGSLWVWVSVESLTTDTLSGS